MHTHIRKTARLLLLPLLLVLLNACAFIRINNPGTPTGTDATTSESESTQNGTQNTPPSADKETPKDPEQDGRNALSLLRTRDLDASTLLIAITDTSLAFAQDSGRLRNESIYAERMERIKWVEEKYNVRIVFFTYTEDGLYTEIEKAQATDAQYVADYYAIPPSLVGKFKASGFLSDLRSLPFTDYTQPYFDSRAMEALSAGHSIYGAVGDFTKAYDGLDAVYFNKDLTEHDLYAAVENGTWTWELYFTYAKEATDTENGISGDNLGLLPLSEAETRMWGASGIHPIKTQLDTAPTLNTAPEIPGALQRMADLLYTNVYKKTTTLPYASGEGNDGGKARFANGTSLYYHGSLSQMYPWSDISVNWGILPLPKLDETQPDYANYAHDSTVFCVPSTTVESDKSGLVLQALFAASYHAYEDTYLSDALTYHIRDGKTADMLDIIVSSASYDFSAMFAGGYEEISSATVGALHGAVTTKNDAHTLFANASGAAEALLARLFPIYP